MTMKIHSIVDIPVRRLGRYNSFPAASCQQQLSRKGHTLSTEIIYPIFGMWVRECPIYICLRHMNNDFASKRFRTN